jgi:hypothetical protein
MTASIVKLIVAIAGLIFIGWVINRGIENQATQTLEYWENRDFKTDSQTVHIDYSKIPMEKLINNVPPAVVVQYIDSTKTYNNQYVEASDSLFLVIDSLEGVIAEISKDFLLNYPHSHKLIQGVFKEDTLMLDLLKINGSIVREVYPVNYNRFMYNYSGNEFTAGELKTGVNKHPMFYDLGLYGSTGYHWTNRVPLAGVSADVSIGERFKLYADSHLSIESKPSLFLRGTIQYKLKAWLENGQ